MCESCLKCVKTRLLILIFSNLDYQIELEKLHQQKKQTYCGKILDKDDIGVKCIDCELDETCIICQECFEKGNHQGHRTRIQRGCAGCCDCGDVGAWKEQGFCSDHQANISKEDLDFNNIEIGIRIKIKEVIQGIFYDIFYQFEETFNQLNSFYIQKDFICQRLVFIGIEICEILSGKTILMQNFLNFLINENRGDENKYELKHCCLDIQNQTNQQNLLLHFIKRNNQYCTCSIMENLLRFLCCINLQNQQKIKHFLINMFSVFEFKINLVKAYVKMFHFIFQYSETEELQYCPFQDLAVQFFTSNLLNECTSSYQKDDEYFEFEKQNFKKKFFSRFYFINFFEKILEICELKHGFEELFKNAFQHVKYMTFRNKSIDYFIQNEDFQVKLTEVCQKIHFRAKFLLPKIPLDAFFDNVKELQRAVEAELLIQESFMNIVYYLFQLDNIEKKKKLYFSLIGKIMDQILGNSANTHALNIQFSSINIPLHRVLVLLLFCYFQLDWDNVNDEKLNELKVGLGKSSFENFDYFFIQQLKYPLRTVNFIREIYNGLWVYQGENFKYQIIWYCNCEIQFQILDCLFIQFCFRILKNINFFDIWKSFSIRQEFMDIYSQEEKIIKEEDKFQFLQVKMYKDLLEFINYILVDKMNVFNFCTSFYYEIKKPNLNEKTNQFSNFFMSSVLHKNSNFDIMFVQKIFQQYMSKLVDFSKQINYIATFSQSNKKFSLKKDFDNIYDYSYYFWYSSLLANYYSFLHEKKENQEKAAFYILGNCFVDEVIAENLINKSFFEFLLNLLQNKIQQINIISFWVQPILKIINIYQVYIENKGKKDEETSQKCQKILSLLENQNFTEELNQTIKQLVNLEDNQTQEMASQKNTCIICKKDALLNYGVLAFAQKMNLNQQQSKNQKKQGFWHFHSCFHIMHNQCYLDFVNIKYQQENIELNCPICHRIFNIFVEFVESSQNNQSFENINSFLFQLECVNNNNYYSVLNDLDENIEQKTDQEINMNLENSVIEMIKIIQNYDFYSFLQKNRLIYQILKIVLQHFNHFFKNESQYFTQKQQFVQRFQSQIENLNQICFKSQHKKIDQENINENKDQNNIQNNEQQEQKINEESEENTYKEEEKQQNKDEDIHLLQTDIQDQYLKYLFNQFAYFQNSNFLIIIQDSLIQVLSAKYYQFLNCKKDILQKKPLFNQNEIFCEQNISFIYQIWALYSLFIDLNENQLVNLNLQYDNEIQQINSLIYLFGIKQPEIEKKIKKSISQLLDIPQILDFYNEYNCQQFQFIKIDNNFNDFFNKYYNKKCENCNSYCIYGPMNLCIICGKVLCQNKCSKNTILNKGNLNSHCLKEHYGSGVFIEISTTNIIVIQSPHNYRANGIYTDEYGQQYKQSHQGVKSYRLDFQLLNILRDNYVKGTLLDWIVAQQQRNNQVYLKNVF
ncbi:hypothetical protein IMG5_000780 [Ichthyophthirius multifiliis]|uniref:E3 ubiquitin-protein ligase n=1 Tax=Ichthyophthirius multifiliis TaxID=5932 RepID=G0QIW5_ICHMU|nr:hypothetical protein IMG5_000780 [Ichthyophthirius multifiliis]EGR34850.1 hypothetical protein IMG5_000780 [Ichthyophthirius multifiliis]|eukprot:XP_004040154.1 hypothetical protein IMG5_000780 [Ichthyophthirius multifiliis]